jgi:hypothetical protein
MTDLGDLTVGDQLEVFQVQIEGDPRLSNVSISEKPLHLVVVAHSGRGAFGIVVLCWSVERLELVAVKMFPVVPVGQQDPRWLHIAIEYGVRITTLYNSSPCSSILSHMCIDIKSSLVQPSSLVQCKNFAVGKKRFEIIFKVKFDVK